MDIQIEKKTGFRALFTKKNLPYFLGLLFVMFVVWLIFRDHSSTLRVDGRTLTVSTVTEGEFNDYVRITGQVQPITTVLLSPLENGVVERLVVEEGATVHKGDVLVELSNSALNLQILDSEAQLAEKQNYLRETQVTMEQQRLSLRQEELQLNLDMQRRKRTYEQQTALYNDRLLAKEDWLQAKENYEIAADKLKLNLERQVQDSLFRSVQVTQMENNLESMDRNMTLIRKRVSNLNIKSPIDGELGMLDVVLGQSINSGTSIGQINDLSDYKVETQIDEHYIDRVRAGLEGTYERQDKTYGLSVRKVYPEVRNGQFRADFIFEGERPENIRSGQSYYINLQLGQPTEAVIIPRGAFYQSTGGSWIYVLDESGDKAYKRSVRIGRQNPQYYEVTEGLNAGEKVITSSYETFGDNDVLILNK